MKKDANHWERYREIGFRIAYCRKYQKMTIMAQLSRQKFNIFIMN